MNYVVLACCLSSLFRKVGQVFDWGIIGYIYSILEAPPSHAQVSGRASDNYLGFLAPQKNIPHKQLYDNILSCALGSN
jgi:hypothetical protein